MSIMKVQFEIPDEKIQILGKVMVNFFKKKPNEQGLIRVMDGHQLSYLGVGNSIIQTLEDTINRSMEELEEDVESMELNKK